MIHTLKRGLEKWLTLLLQFLRRHRARNPLAHIASHQDPQLKAIGIALQESLYGQLSKQEKIVISLIERRRSFLLSSNEKIALVDYGAGSSSSNRTREEMERGVSSTEEIAKITRASKPQFWATVLFKLIRKLKPLSCVELGSCVGVSASYQASALNMNGRGTLVTLEGSPEIANVARETLESLGIKNTSVVKGPFHETLAGVLEAAKPIDFLFNDGHHDHDAVMQYFNEAVPFLSHTAVIVFDDISWSPGMRKAWAEIQRDERVSATIDLRSIGIALLNKSSSTKERLEIPL